MGSLPNPLSLVSSFSLAVRIASLHIFVVALFIFLAISTSSPCAGVLRTPVRVRGEAVGYLSCVSLNVTPPLMHRRVIKEGRGCSLRSCSQRNPDWAVPLSSLHSDHTRLQCIQEYATILSHS